MEGEATADSAPMKRPSVGDDINEGAINQEPLSGWSGTIGPEKPGVCLNPTLNMTPLTPSGEQKGGKVVPENTTTDPVRAKVITLLSIAISH